MPNFKTSRKGVVLLIVLGTVIAVSFLAAVILTMISNHSRLTHHQVNRINAYYAAKGIMNYAQDMLRKGGTAGGWDADPAVNRYACLGNCAGLGVSSPTYTIPPDSDMLYNILVTIYPLNHADNASLNGKVTQFNIKVDYNYTP